jgi:hypothetical protein
MSEHKIQERHRQRLAVIYIRQSSFLQVEHHTEGRERQYQLVERAQHLGWPAAHCLVIDEDMGISGAHSHNRPGYQRLISMVALREVGLVLGLDVSRLARNSLDWYQLLELAGAFDVLIADEDGVYHPGDFNDRLLLGLKRPASYCTSGSTSCHVSMIGGGCLPTVELGHPGTICSPAPAMPAADIAHMLARERTPKCRPPAALP